MTELIELLFGLRTLVGPVNCIRLGPDPTMGWDNFEEKGRPIVKYRTLCGYLCRNG